MATGFMATEYCTVNVVRDHGGVKVVIKYYLTGKFIEIPRRRWPSFFSLRHGINRALELISRGKEVTYFVHIGDDWYVNVSTGSWQVDIRRYYRDEKSGEMKPTDEGLAMSGFCWKKFLDGICCLMKDIPELLVNEVLFSSFYAFSYVFYFKILQHCLVKY